MASPTGCMSNRTSAPGNRGMEFCCGCGRLECVPSRIPPALHLRSCTATIFTIKELRRCSREACGAGNGLCTQDTPTLQCFDLKPFHADAAITSRFNELSSVVEFTAPLERAPPTWRIKLMSRQRVGPEQASQCPILTPVVTPAAINRVLSSTSVYLTPD